MAGNTVVMKSAAQADDDGRRERSKIAFPYGDLENAIDVARAIHSNNAGMSCSTEQLAAFMKQSATSGAFRANLSTARIFGLIESDKGQIALTDIGRRVVDPSQEKRARAEAFLRVPLYEAIYTKYKQHMLPPVAALEREMLQLGVSSKQTDKARQAFDRSANQANFFEHGRERLVMPIFQIGAPETVKMELPTDKKQKFGGGGYGGGGRGGDLDPLIEGLLNRLPPPDSDWNIFDQGKWLQAIAHAFALMYKHDGDEELKITVVRAD